MSIRSILMTFFVFLFCFSCRENESAIKIKGSDTEVNLVVQLAEGFQKTNPDFYVSISGGGSGLGIASLLNGEADIANSSRRMNENEIELFRNRKIEIDTFIFAEDAIAFVVSPDLPIDSIRVDVLAKVLSGATDNWKALAGEDLHINIYGRQSNSGTHDFIKKKLGIDFSRQAREMNGNAQIIEAIKADRSGIGYVGAGYVKSGSSGKKKLKVLRIAATDQDIAISPFDSVAISQKRYFFQRPLYQYIVKRSSAKASSFIKYEKSREGGGIIEASGYYSVQDQ